MDAKFETDHPEMRELLADYALLLRRSDRISEAEALEARALAIPDPRE